MRRGTWHCPPECQGQVVIVEYADTFDGLVWRRTYDQSDRSETIEVASADDAETWEPWNGEPEGFAWRLSSRSDFDRAERS